MLCLLVFFQARRIGHDSRAVGLAQRRLDRGQPVQLEPALPLLELGVRDGGHQRAVRVVEQLGADEVLEEAPLRAGRLQALQVAVEVEPGERIAAVQVGGHRREEHAQRVGEPGVGAFALFELQVMDGGVDLRRVDALAGQPIERVEHDALHLLGVLGRDALQSGTEDRLLVVVVKSASVGERAAQARVYERLAQGRAGVGQQHLGEHFHGEGPKRIRARHRHPGGQRLRLAVVVLARCGGVRLRGRRRPHQAGDVWNRRIDLNPLEPRQGGALDHLKRGLQRLVAIRVKARVARVVVAPVKEAQLLPGEVRDVLRIATRNVLVGKSLEQRLPNRAIDRGARGGERSLHLVEDDALVAKTALGVGRILELEADPFLLERILGEMREEGGVQVHVEQVPEVLRVAGAEQVHRPVGAGERIHERGERAPGHAEERVPDRKAL